MATLPKPEEVKECYDFGPEALDRYTVILDKDALEYPPNWPMNPAFALSEYPTAQYGISQFTECLPGPHLGEVIPWEKLPESVQVHVSQRLNDE